jgi:hypothetical protein
LHVRILLLLIAVRDQCAPGGGGSQPVIADIRFGQNPVKEPTIAALTINQLSA